MDYPSALPVIKQQGYAYNLDLGISRTVMADGGSRLRRVSKARTAINASLVLNQSQMKMFEAFAMLDAHDWFNAKVLTGQAVQSLPVRIVGNYQHAFNSGLHQVAFVLELQSHPVSV